MSFRGRCSSFICGLGFLVTASGAALEPDVLRASQPASTPSRWVGATGARRISITVAATGAPPATVATEKPTRRARGALEVTDLAFDTSHQLVYVATCCEPGSGQLSRLDLNAPTIAFTQDDQGFAVDVASRPPIVVRTDTWGTLAVRTSSADEAPEVTEGTGVVDVAVEGGPIETRPARGPMPRLIALVDSRRLRALVPTVPVPEDSAHDPGLLVRTRTAAGRWTEARHALPPLSEPGAYCRVVPLAGGAVGLLVGARDERQPWRCTGDRLDVYDPARAQMRRSVLTFPGRVQHLGIDDSSSFLIFTTVDGAVGWQTLDGRGGTLAERGFVAADW